MTYPILRGLARLAARVYLAGGLLEIEGLENVPASGGLRRAEPGAGFIAQQTGVPVLPVAMIGTRDCWPKGAWFPRRARVRIVHGRPFRLRARTPEGSRVPAQAAADAIMVAIAEMLPEELRGEYADLGSWSERLGGLRVYEAGSAGG